MPKTYNLYNLEAPFKEYLLAGNQKPISIKNYLSDIRHFFGWLILYFKSKDIRVQSETTITQFITTNTISEYKSYLSENHAPHKTINRRLSTLRKFCSFCISQGWIKENPAKKVNNITPSSVIPKSGSEIDDILKIFSQDLLKDNLDSKIVNSYCGDIKEFLGLI
jgi:site-specific recombinase XerD